MTVSNRDSTPAAESAEGEAGNRSDRAAAAEHDGVDHAELDRSVTAATVPPPQSMEIPTASTVQRFFVFYLRRAGNPPLQLNGITRARPYANFGMPCEAL